MEEAADYLCISPWTIRAMAADGKIPVVRIGRRVLFDVQDLDRMIDFSKTKKIYS